jgi:general stress protein 26
MKIEEQNSPELRSLAEHIEGSRSAMLTMCYAQGHLSSQPMTVIEMDGQGCLWMLISKS